MVTKLSWILPSLEHPLGFFLSTRVFFGEFLHPLHPPNFNQINRKWHRQFVQRYLLGFPTPCFGIHDQNPPISRGVCVASRFPPSDFLKLWYGICLGKITTRRFHWFLVVLKTKHSKNMGFSSKRPFQMLIRRNFQHQNILKQESPPRSFLFQKLWVRQVGPKNITTKNQKPVEIWELSKDRNVSRCDDVMASGSDIWKRLNRKISILKSENPRWPLAFFVKSWESSLPRIGGENSHPKAVGRIRYDIVKI